jgi:hypothetical protein
MRMRISAPAGDFLSDFSGSIVVFILLSSNFNFFFEVSVQHIKDTRVNEILTHEWDDDSTQLLWAKKMTNGSRLDRWDTCPISWTLPQPSNQKKAKSIAI